MRVANDNPPCPTFPGFADLAGIRPQGRAA